MKKILGRFGLLVAIVVVQVVDNVASSVVGGQDLGEKVGGREHVSQLRFVQLSNLLFVLFRLKSEKKV